MKTVLVGTIRLRHRGLDRNILGSAVSDHFCATGELGSIFLNAPGSNNLHSGLKCLGSQLESALIVSLAGRSVCVSVRSNILGDLETDLGDQRTCDRCSEQVDAFISRLPLHNLESEVATEFFLDIDDLSRFCSTGVSLLQNRLAVFARLPQIDIDTVDIVSFILQPTENNRRIQSARISEHTARHGKSFQESDAQNPNSQSRQFSSTRLARQIVLTNSSSFVDRSKQWPAQLMFAPIRCDLATSTWQISLLPITHSFHTSLQQTVGSIPPDFGQKTSIVTSIFFESTRWRMLHPLCGNDPSLIATDIHNTEVS